MLDFGSVQNALQKLGASVDAAEAHGTLCGLLLDNCGMAVWLRHTLDILPDSADVLAAEQLKTLNLLFEHSRQQINAEDMSFELLLPDGSNDFGAQLMGLSTWCAGFLYGLSVAMQHNTRQLDKASQECLSDLLEISRLDYDEVKSAETEEQFFTILEHVRVSVLFLNEAVNRVMPAPQLQ